jgi:transposase
MAAPCREYSISRKTGYKIFERYEECGLEGLAIAPGGRSQTSGP